MPPKELTKTEFDYATSNDLTNIEDLKKAWAFEKWWTFERRKDTSMTQELFDTLLDDFDNNPLVEYNSYKVWDEEVKRCYRKVQ